jgi:hypothetical protein
MGLFLGFWSYAALLTQGMAGEKGLRAAEKIIPSQSFAPAEKSITGSCNFGFDPLRNGA